MILNSRTHSKIITLTMANVLGVMPLVMAVGGYSNHLILNMWYSDSNSLLIPCLSPVLRNTSPAEAAINQVIMSRFIGGEPDKTGV